MPWSKLDDEFYDHPKVIQAGTAATGLFAMALSYTARKLTDGFVSTAMIRRLCADMDDPLALAERLVDAGLFEAVEDGYFIHDYLDYNPSSRDIKAQREIAGRRWAMNHDPDLRDAVRARDGDVCRFCGKTVNWKDRKGADGGTYDHIVPISAGGTESADNIVVCCRACNSRKGARTPSEAEMPLRPASGADQARIKPGSSPDQARNQDIPSPSPSPYPDSPDATHREARKRAAPSPSGRSRADPRTKHPAIQCVRGIAGKLPSKALYDPLIAALGETPDGELVAKCYQEWIKRGYNPNAMTWALDWYAAGGPPEQQANRRNGARASPNEPTLADFQAIAYGEADT